MSGTGAKEYASAADQSIRLFIHATLGPDSFDRPQDVDAVLAELAALAGRLPQALDQVCRGLLRLHNAGQVGHDADLTGLDLDDEVEDAADEIGRAVRAARAVGAALDEARQVTSHFTGGAR